MAYLTDIIWSPNHEDRFCVIFRNIIFLLRIKDFDGSLSESGRKIKVIGTKYKFALTLLDTSSEYDGVKAFAWRPSLNIKTESPVIPPSLVAIGLSSGNVKLTSLQNVDPLQDIFCLNRKDLISHANRFSSFLHWNPWRTSLLAHGLERGKHNRSSSVLVWDVIRESGARHQPDTSSSSEFFKGLPSDSLYNMTNFAGDICVKGRQTQSFCDRPLCDACQNESAVSFAWVSKNSFVVGLANRHIKLYDISDTAKTIQMTQTRLVNGLTSDPLLPTRFASFCQNQIGLWTSENLEKPIYVFTERKEVVCMKWSPLREGWLGVLLAESIDIKVYNTLLTFSRPMEESEQFLFELRATTSTGEDDGDTVSGNIAPLVSFAWHGSIVNCIITIDRGGCLNVAKVHEMTALSWSPNHTFLWTVGSTWLGIDRTGLFGCRGYTSPPPSGLSATGSETSATLIPSSSSPIPRSSRLPERFVNGIAQLTVKLDTNLDSAMQRRADAGYGLEVLETPYSEMVGDDPQLRSLWILIEYLQECIEDWAPYGKCQDTTLGGVRGRTGGAPSGSVTTNLRCQGALAILCGDDQSTSTSATSEVVDEVDWQGIDAHLPFPRYTSSERSRVLRMCMWPLDAPADVQRRVFESVCSDLEFERAAAMALINLQFDWALSFLSRASEYRRSKETETESDRVGAGSATIAIATALTSSETDLIALALSGFSDPHNHLWRNACSDMLGRLSNPYLRLMFRFLTAARGDFANDVHFTEILEDDDLFLIDRLAFACLYLNDDQLREYVHSILDRMLRDGRLEAVLLTGLSSPRFFDLLQHYVDLTFDVQTAAILGLHACYLCRRAAPPTPTQTVGTSAAAATSTPAATRVVAGAQTRLRLRGFRNAVDRPSLSPSAGVTSAAPQVDQMVATLGGRRLANWVETYRDMLDRWRMWFYRVDFDNHYATRLVTPFLHGSGQARTAGGAGGGGGGGGSINVSSNASGGTSREVSLLNLTKPPPPPITPIRGIGLPAAASQIFVSCIYCGWRLGGVVRGTAAESAPSAPTVSSPVSNSTSAATISTAVTAGTGTVSATSMHAGGGKQTICWHCLKPLPRCCICLMHMGSEVCDLIEAKTETDHKKTAPSSNDKTVVTSKSDRADTIVMTSLKATLGAVSSKNANDDKATEGSKSANVNILRSNKTEVAGGSSDASRGGPLRLASWFVWCQACRHGGHAAHIFHWFYGDNGTLPPNLIECPVNGCFCRCAGLDSSVPQPRPTPLPSVPTTMSAGSVGEDLSKFAGLMRATMHEVAIDQPPTPSSSSSSSIPLSSPTLASMDVVGGKLLKRNAVTPASVPKNRREIVDPVVFAMTDAGEGDEEGTGIS